MQPQEMLIEAADICNLELKSPSNSDCITELACEAGTAMFATPVNLNHIE